MAVNRIDNSCLSLLSRSEESEAKTQKICEMAAIMKKAIELDEKSSDMEQQWIAALKCENEGLRELLSISSTHPLDRESEESGDEQTEFQSYVLQHIPPDLEKKDEELKDEDLFDGLENGSQPFSLSGDGMALKKTAGYK